MLITNGVLEQLAVVMHKLGESTQPQITNFVAVNMKKMLPHLEVIQQARQLPPGYKQYLEEANLLLLETARIDSDGKPVVSQGRSVAGNLSYEIEDVRDYANGMRLLNRDYAVERSEFMGREVTLFNLFRDEVDLVFTPLKMSRFPSGLLDGNSAALLLYVGALEMSYLRKVEG